MKRRRQVLECKEKSRTRQSEKENTDINVIVARYAKTGQLPVTGLQGQFADVSEMPDYRTALETVRDAERSFNRLPAEVRAAFGNDPAAFLDAFHDPEQLERLEALGLVEKTAEEVPEAVAPAAPAS